MFLIVQLTMVVCVTVRMVVSWKVKNMSHQIRKQLLKMLNVTKTIQLVEMAESVCLAKIILNTLAQIVSISTFSNGRKLTMLR